MRVLRILVGFSCVLGTLFGAADGAVAVKPKCDASRSGMLWPAEANLKRETFYQLSQDGTLEVCTYGSYRALYRYHWHPLTVSYRSLLQQAKDKHNAQRTNTR